MLADFSRIERLVPRASSVYSSSDSSESSLVFGSDGDDRGPRRRVRRCAFCAPFRRFRFLWVTLPELVSWSLEERLSVPESTKPSLITLRAPRPPVDTILEEDLLRHDCRILSIVDDLEGLKALSA